ncbi:hypothetical protein H072_981 [Dactylellina haptotyla CBS 200.50]|uniref:Thioredoxin domain-containing protein n=1 Tax=Dactylellina haptotyla (strain CBS 200.50) TaxID=1284197 RepID=S8AQ18_DACHA|nr:hypothetical protein H072_981 [Dactylellina haptotyla CBS 200.50]
MKLSTLLLPLALSLSTASAQWEHLQSILNPGPRAPAVEFVPEPGVIYPVDKKNYREVLQFTEVDFLVLFTTGAANCPGCELYEKTFNDTIAILHDNKNIHFARVLCDEQALLCSIFSAWGARIFHISHTKTASSVFSGVKEHNTHIHPVPFHRPGTESTEPIKDEKGKDIRPPPPPPDAAWIAEVVNDGKWKDYDEWTGGTQPFEGIFQQPLYLWWWIVSLFSSVPPMAMMVGIGLFSRYFTGRFTGRMLAPPKPQEAQAAAAGAARAVKKTN